MRRKLGFQNEAGLTLVELAVAVLILSIGSLAAVRATDQSRIAIGSAQTRMFAQIAARNRGEELKIFGPTGGTGLPQSVTIGAREFIIDTSVERTAGGLDQVTITAKNQRAGALFITYPQRGLQ